jgi:hypothetical protein
MGAQVKTEAAKRSKTFKLAGVECIMSKATDRVTADNGKYV